MRGTSLLLLSSEINKIEMAFLHACKMLHRFDVFCTVLLHLFCRPDPPLTQGCYNAGSRSPMLKRFSNTSVYMYVNNSFVQTIDLESYFFLKLFLFGWCPFLFLFS
mmetsp:Transcript_37427/g.87285  ORF Transcript_37427/g.87285 Transcript_37427/m.87285 type:complete len:106 (-) Transcript_37427:593-910(-)